MAALTWFVQPEGKTPVAEADLMPFLERLRVYGYGFTDPALHNLAYYRDEVKLLDPFAVCKLAEDT